MKLPLENLIGPILLFYLKIPAIASTEHLPGTNGQVCGTPKNQIEIWYDGKNQKTHIADIDQDLLLFPYTTR
jgi:hypothetical protein